MSYNYDLSVNDSVLINLYGGGEGVILWFELTHFCIFNIIISQFCNFSLFIIVFAVT